MEVGWDVPLGSYPYMDPTYLLNGKNSVQYTEKTDVYSLGVILYEMIYGKQPFQYLNMKKLMDLLKKGDYGVKSGLPVAVAAIIFRCLRKSPEERPSIQSLAAMVSYAIKATEPKLESELTFSNTGPVPSELAVLPNTPSNPLPMEKLAIDQSSTILHGKTDASQLQSKEQGLEDSLNVTI
jgi:serine/threonine-protein kinase